MDDVLATDDGLDSDENEEEEPEEPQSKKRGRSRNLQSAKAEQLRNEAAAFGILAESGRKRRASLGTNAGPVVVPDPSVSFRSSYRYARQGKRQGYAVRVKTTKYGLLGS